MFSDFGLCKDSVYDKKTYSFCGTVEYMAPEVSVVLYKHIAVHYNCSPVHITSFLVLSFSNP